MATLALLCALVAALVLAVPGLAKVRNEIGQMDPARLVIAAALELASDISFVPAGIGVLDAGLVGAVVLYGVSPASAAAAVLVYRAIALWMPGLGGLLAYLRLAMHAPPSPSDGCPGAAPHRAAP